MPRTRIKICGLTRDDDVHAAVQAGADAIGFVRYPASPRYVSAERALALAQHLPAFVTSVLLYVNEDATKVIADYALFMGAKRQFVAQYHGDETPEQCSAAGISFMRAARVPLDAPQSVDLVQFSQDFAAAQAILVDAHVQGYGGGGQAFDWKAVNWSHPQLNASSRLVLSGGLTPANVTDGILQARPWAVDVSSGVESAKGVKDPDKIHQFVAAVRRADALLAKE